MALPQSINGTEVGRFYDNLRRSALSAAALAHGDAYVGQECLLTPEDMLAFARQAGMTSATTVLDIGSGTGGPACYLAQQLGCRVVGVDVSTVGHEQAMARARDQGLTHLVQFQHGDVHTVDLPPAAFIVEPGQVAFIDKGVWHSTVPMGAECTFVNVTRKNPREGATEEGNEARMQRISAVRPYVGYVDLKERENHVLELEL